MNHKLVPLSYTLQSGDQVEILTSKKQLPQPEWIEYVTTARAKSKLKNIFRREEKTAIAEGQRLIEEALAAINLSPDNQHYVKILNHYKFVSRNALFLHAGKGNINLEEISKIIFKPKSQSVFAKYIKIPFVNTGDKQKDTPRLELVPASRVDRNKTFVLNEENVGKTYKFAECCKPIPGDDVLGYIDDNEIVMVHKRQCPIASKLKSNFGNSIISAKWATHKALSFHEVIEMGALQ